MTTLRDARKTLLQLINTLPAKSTYAERLAVVSDYLDKQVPLNIENANLTQRLANAEAFIATWSKEADAMYAEIRAAVPPTYQFPVRSSNLLDTECIARIVSVASRCACNACLDRGNA